MGQIMAIEFTPHPEIALTSAEFDPAIHKATYKFNYEAILNELGLIREKFYKDNPLIWEKTWTQVFRDLYKCDLFFMVMFGLEIPIANHPFIVNMCKMVEEGHNTDTLDIWARNHFKAVDVNEPVFTVDGWKNHGDLEIGDKVFNPEGSPIAVIGKTEVFHDADCYRVTFDTGYSVVVSGDHLWEIEVQSKKRIKGNVREKTKKLILPTREIQLHVSHSGRVKTRISPRVKMCKPIYFKEKDLPIAPYALGAWLGDGSRKTSKITSAISDHKEMIELLIDSGHRATTAIHSNAVTLSIDAGIKGKRGTNTFSASLRSLGIFESKQIPEQYFMASEAQRMELLRGLMDTDGTIHRVHSQAIFCNTNYQLAEDVHTLVSSLGMKASLRRYTGLYKGERRGFYNVCFKGEARRNPFNLKRKAAICSDVSPVQTRYRKIKSVEPVESQPVSCIQVDSSDGLYLIGKHFVPTHNSTILTQAETIQMIVNDPEKCHCILSYSKTAADKFTTAIKDTLEKPSMIACFPDILYERPETQSSSWSVQNGIRVKRNSVSRPQHTVNSYGLVEGMPTGGHWDRLVFDDTETEDMGRSADQIATLKKAFEMAQNLGMPSGTLTRVIGTFYTHSGLLTFLRDKKYPGSDEPMYTYRKIPCTDDGTRDGNPVFLDKATHDKKKGDSTYNSQQLCDPTPTTDIKLDFKLLNPIDPRFIPKNRLKFVIIDPAGDDSVQSGKSNDRWAQICVSVEMSMDEMGNSRVFLEDIIADQMGLNEAIDAGCLLYTRNGRIQVIGVEKTANDTTYEHIRKGLKARGRHVEIIPGKHASAGGMVLLGTRNRNKYRRIEAALSWPLSNGKLFYSTAIPQKYIDMIKDEMGKFPYYHVDILDAWAYLYDILADYEFPSNEEDDEDEEETQSHMVAINGGRSSVGGY